MKFYRIKHICIDLGITAKTLYRKIESGQLPTLEHPNPINTRVAGYSESTFRRVIALVTQSPQSTQSSEQESA